ncbi:MAG: hypothetical protein CMM60_07770 [Rhodospirillaceae bacterium]|nr:hypothetical protein [Rhodospirillaceae bacterium]
MISDALAYAEKGWPIFPARPDKTPYTKHGVLDATTDPKRIEAWWERWPQANIALDVGSAGMMVLDLDPDHSMEELEKNIGPIPETKLRASTPRGGKHLFFRIDQSEIVAPSASKLAPHVDVRSFHSYVLLTPSSTADGTYVWESEGKPHYRTDEMLRLANMGREKHKDRDEWLIAPDDPDNIASAIKWLREDAKIAVEGQGGDHMAFATAAHMKSFGISEALAFELIWEHWNPRCSPPWSTDNVEHLQQKVENGYAYNTSPPGNVTPAYHVAKTAALFKPVTKELERGHEWNAGRFRFVNREGMSSIQPPEWLIEDFLPQESYAMLFGAPGTFKTFLALDIALSIAVGVGMGEDICWPAIANSGPVLFAAGEGRGNITARVKAWEKTHFVGNEVENFRLADPVPLVSEEPKPFIEGALAASPDGYKLVVLDTIGRAMQGLNENTQQDASAFTNMVEHVQYELGATVLALHHTGLNEKHRARGSSVFGADADTIIRAERHSKNYLVSLTMTKQKDAPEWSKKKFVKLREVHLDLETKSLVAFKPDENECPKSDKYHPTESEQEIVMAIINEVVIELLQSDRFKNWSQKALAEAVATDERIEIGSSQLRQRYLKDLREDNSQPASRYYNAGTRKWRYGED